jgi:RNA-directed DNA polymerase
MRVSYGEGLASHTGSESCGRSREGQAEALTGVRAGWVSSLENVFIRSADDLRPSEGHTGRIASARSGRAPRGLRPHARTQAPHKGGHNLPFGSREIPGSAWASAQVRAVNSKEERRQ